MLYTLIMLVCLADAPQACEVREQIDAHHRTLKVARHRRARETERAGDCVATLRASERAQCDGVQPPAEIADLSAVGAERRCEGVMHCVLHPDVAPGRRGERTHKPRLQLGVAPAPCRAFLRLRFDHV